MEPIYYFKLLVCAKCATKAHEARIKSAEITHKESAQNVHEI